LIQTDGLTIDLLSRHAWREDEKIELSSREYALLEYFMRHGGQVLSRQQILSAICDSTSNPPLTSSTCTCATFETKSILPTGRP
jgi:DNA-binding response OmpR family regulator